MKRSNCLYDVEELQNYVKRRKTNERDDGPVFSDKSKKLMQMMGHKEGRGLGKKEQGIVEPIAASDQKGRSGLGAKKGRVETNNNQWNFDAEKPFQCERKVWFEFEGERPFISDDCIRVGEKKLSLEGETNFCQDDILDSILEGKTFFDRVDSKELRKGVSEANIYEKIGKSFFMNRAAVKMANMDVKFKHMFTRPTFPDNSSLVGEDELLTFADICAGPGGFSEYVLWKTKGNAKGYGFTIKGSNDFKLQDFKAGPAEMFEPHYGVGGSDGDGNIYCVDNQESFKTFILNKTKGRGVHFVMADGGFSVENQENIQEILSHRLYLCQAIVALNILVQGGHYVCKLFDLFTEFSCGLIFLLSTCFRKICIFKPVTSRPANSERYLVCEGMRGDVMEVVDFLKRVNAVIKSLDNIDGKDKAVRQLIPLEMMQENEAFMHYITDSNNYLGHLQRIALLKVRTFIENNDLVEGRGLEISNKCLLMWGLNMIRRDEFSTSVSPDMIYKALSMKMGNLQRRKHRMEKESLVNEMKYKRDYVACVIDSHGPYSLLSGGKDKAWIFEHNEWRFYTEVQTNLPYGTLLKVDVVIERRGKKKTFKFEAIDLLCWGEQSYTMCSFQKRRQQLELLLKASNKESMPNYHMNMKKCIQLDDIEKEVFVKLLMAPLPNEGPCPKHLLPLHDALMHVKGLIFLKVNKDPWCANFSRSSNSVYYYNLHTGESTFERPTEADCSYCQTSMIEWHFTPSTLTQDPTNNVEVTKDSFLKYLSSLK